MISTSKVVLEMWMHNPLPASKSTPLLTETMARCLDIHRSKVRAKLHEVAHLFNKSKEEVPPEVYNQFLRMLYRRARHVVEATEVVPTDGANAFMEKLRAAITQDQMHFESVNSQMNQRNRNLTEEVDKKKIEVKMLEEESEGKSQRIGSLSSKNEELKAEKSLLKTDLEKAQDEIDALQLKAMQLEWEKRDSMRLNQLYVKRDGLKADLKLATTEIGVLEEERKRSFKNNAPMYWMLLGLVLVIVFGVLALVEKVWLVSYLSWQGQALLVVCGIISVAISFALNTETRRERKKEEAYRLWEDMHPEYSITKNRLMAVEEELKACQKEITGIQERQTMKD